jgi:hypothetical protein
MTKNRFRFILGTILIGFVPLSYSVTLDATETWMGALVQDWTYYDVSGLEPPPEVFAVVGGELTLQPQPNPSAIKNPLWIMVADSNASGGAFTGDLYDYGVHTLEFDFRTAVDCTLKVQLVNNQGPGNIFNAVTNLLAASGSVHITVPIDLDHFEPDFFGGDELFETILRQTDELWFNMEWDKNEPAPLFSMDNVVLQGAGEGYGTWIDGFGLELRQRFSRLDADGDGFSNADEFNMDSAPNAASLPFTVSYMNNMLEWASSSNCQYAVLRSTNLVSGVFEPVSIFFGDGHTLDYHESEDLPNAFYKVNVERK